jgi:cell division septum initiation protein DivIVA
MEQISNAITELQNKVQRQRDEIAFLRSIISTKASAKPKASLLDPEKFNGQAHKFNTWLPSIRAKLQVDGEAIGNAIAQFYYVYLNLDSHVQAMVLP